MAVTSALIGISVTISIRHQKGDELFVEITVALSFRCYQSIGVTVVKEVLQVVWSYLINFVDLNSLVYLITVRLDCQKDSVRHDVVHPNRQNLIDSPVFGCWSDTISDVDLITATLKNFDGHLVVVRKIKPVILTTW